MCGLRPRKAPKPTELISLSWRALFIARINPRCLERMNLPLVQKRTINRQQSRKHAEIPFNSPLDTSVEDRKEQ